MNKHQLVSEIQTLNDQLAVIEKQEEQDKQDKQDEIQPELDNVKDEGMQNDIVSEIYAQIEHGLQLNDETKSQLKKLVKEVELQFEKLPKTACMSIFTAGIILGKVLK